MQTLIIIASIAFLAYMYLRKGKALRKEILLAAAISAAWVYFSGLYVYKDSNLVVLGLNLFPLLSWTAGLVLFKQITHYLPLRDRFRNSVLVYVAGLMLLEYVGYNAWGIQLASGYPGLFGLPLMHMPWWGQAYYLAIGPIYLKLTKSLVGQ